MHIKNKCKKKRHINLVIYKKIKYNYVSQKNSNKGGDKYEKARKRIYFN